MLLKLNFLKKHPEDKCLYSCFLWPCLTHVNVSDRFYFYYNICLFICYHFWHGSNHTRIERKKEIINKTYFSWLIAWMRLVFPCFLCLLRSLLSTKGSILKKKLSQPLIRHFCYLLDTMLVVLLLSLNFQGLNMLFMILWNLFATGDQTQNLFGAMIRGSMCADGDTQQSTGAWKQTLISKVQSKGDKIR